MTTPHSQAVIPVQPPQDSYGFSELALFKSYSRERFRAEFGVEAPPFDPARLIKTWFDSAADTADPANVAVYKVIARDPKGQWGIRQMVLPASEAATVNLPGKVTYPLYVIAPTRAARAGVSGVWPVTLSLESEARALLAELGLSNAILYDEGAGSAMPVDYGDDPRRMWNFAHKGQSYSVGGLLASKHREGIGAPGRWVIGETIEWIADPPAPTGLDDTRPPRELPVRDLLPNERIAQTLMGALIVRTDRQQALAEATGQFTAADRAVLLDIQRRLADLAVQL